MNQMDSSLNYGLICHPDLINHLTNQNKMIQEQIQMMQNQIQMKQEQIFRNNIFIQNLMNQSIFNSILNRTIFYDINKEKGIYIQFKTTSGLNTLIYTRDNIPIKSLLEIYMIRINMENILYDQDLIFCFNGEKLDKNDTREISHPNINIGNNSLIVVCDMKNRISKI